MGLIPFFDSLKEVKYLVENSDYVENPRISLKNIVSWVRDHPSIDKLVMGSDTYNLILETEESASKGSWPEALNGVLNKIGIGYYVIGGENIPSKGSVLYVCNHAYGLVDSCLVGGGLGGDT